MDDYYELLGVDEDAPVDDIRAAYRDKRAAAVGTGADKDTGKKKSKEKAPDSDEAKAEAAALNKAWNVLSDPYQRGRYDQQRANPNGSGADDVGDDDDDDGAEKESSATAPVRRPRSTAKTRGESRREARQPLKPSIALPAGMGFPTTRRRLVAMVIDLAMLLVLFIGSQVLAVHLEKSAHRATYDEVSTLNKTTIPKAESVTSAAKKVSSAADKAYTTLVKTKGADDAATQSALATKKTADAKYNSANNAEKALNKTLTKDDSVLAPTQNLVSGGFFLLALLILLIPSLFGGQTIGKRQQRIRVVRRDGSPARAGDLFRRYAVLVFAAYVLSSFLRSPVGALIVVFVATMWTRNPNQQALHDRFAKTLVVTDVED